MGIASDSDAEMSETSSLLANATSNTYRVVHHNHRPIGEVNWAKKLKRIFPCYSWMSEYEWSMLPMDFIAGVSLASYQIPLSISFASALAHVPTSSGLLGLTLSPMVYTFMGSVPQMIVGPEAAVSMIIGQTLEKVAKHDPDVDVVDVLSAVVFLSGVVLLVFGILRFGFIANVLSATLLKGFITAIGVSMIVNSVISICGLTALLKQLPKDVHVHTTIEKVRFLFCNIQNAHKATTVVGASAFLTLLLLRKLKGMLVPKYRWLKYFPEILFVVVASTFLSYALDFQSYDIEVIGHVSLKSFQLRNPFCSNVRRWWGDMFLVSFTCAILGFFETSTAANSLGSSLETPISNDKELIAIGTCGIFVSYFGGLTAFGGYARSKLNAMIGGKSPLSGFFMGLTTLFVTWKMLKLIYYLPNCVLNGVICIVGFNMIEETPRELKFHIRLKGWNEIITFFVTLLASMFYSIEIGVAMGCFYSLMRVLKHSTKSRVQILSRVAGTDTFVNSDIDHSESTSLFKFPAKLVIKGYKEYRRQSMADNLPLPSSPKFNNNREASLISDTIDESRLFPDLEDREGCLIVKIAEPLTFFNANDMKARLKRIELYGSTHGNPNLLKRDPQSLRHIVFDVRGMTSIDSCATEILYTIIDNFQKRGINVLCCRINNKKSLLTRLKDSGISALLSLTIGDEFGIPQTVPPYYDEILDALKAIDAIDSSCNWETQSYLSRVNYDV